MAYSFRSQSVMLEPDFEAGEQWARKAIEIAEQTDATAALVHAYNNLGACLHLAGRPRRAPTTCAAACDLAIEHHLPDDVGRAYANLTGQGNRIFPFAYAESEALLRGGRSSTPPARSPTASSTDGSAPAGANSSSSPADGRRRSP